jgi:hypothetical protein
MQASLNGVLMRSWERMTAYIHVYTHKYTEFAQMTFTILIFYYSEYF